MSPEIRGQPNNCTCLKWIITHGSGARGLFIFRTARSPGPEFLPDHVSATDVHAGPIRNKKEASTNSGSQITNRNRLSPAEANEQVPAPSCIRPIFLLCEKLRLLFAGRAPVHEVAADLPWSRYCGRFAHHGARQLMVSAGVGRGGLGRAARNWFSRKRARIAEYVDSGPSGETVELRRLTTGDHFPSRNTKTQNAERTSWAATRKYLKPKT
jgi:hypothetical protein